MQHFTATEAVTHLSAHKLPHDLHRSFAVLRDPLDRYISHYLWTPEGEKSGRDPERFFAEIFLPSLGDKDVEARHRWPQRFFISDLNNKIVVRYLINFVHLERGFIQVADLLGLSVGELPHLKRSLGNGSSSGNRIKTIPTYIRYFLEGFYHADYELVKTFRKGEAFIENPASPLSEFEKLDQLSQMVRDHAISTALKAVQAGMPHQPFAYGLASLYYKSSNLKEADRHLLQLQNGKLACRVRKFRRLLRLFALTQMHRIPTIDRKMRRFIRAY